MKNNPSPTGKAEILEKMDALLSAAESQSRDFNNQERIQWSHLEKRLFLINQKSK